ncbi:MAG: redoxin family protein [Chitinophagaceae bacterium]|nr:redoxin family protein [Chitinophagaceae bacterium]
MEKIILALLVPALIALKAIAPSDPLAIGSVMPKADVSMQDISGKSVTLAGAKKENGLLVMFSCNTCPVVIKNQDRTRAIARFALDQNVGVILLNPNEDYRDNGDSHADMVKFAQAQQYNWYYAVDKNHVLADAFGAKRTPECFLFDKNNKLVYHGAIDDNPQDEDNAKRQHLKEAITEMNAGKPVNVAVTKSVGCGIKRKG